jgi:hypothetical protein
MGAAGGEALPAETKLLISLGVCSTSHSMAAATPPLVFFKANCACAIGYLQQKQQSKQTDAKRTKQSEKSNISPDVDQVC